MENRQKINTFEIDLISQVEQYKAASHSLVKEGAKIETILAMMNGCADKCQLSYFETGIKD